MRDSRRLRSILLFLFAAILPWATSLGQVPPSHVLVEGEDLIYNVRYGFIDLGRVRIQTLRRDATPGRIAYECKALIDSYPRIPFVDLHAIYESLIDTAVYSHLFVGRTKQDDWWNFARYRFDYQNRRVTLEMGKKDTLVEKRDTMDVQGIYQDGLSLFFYARDQMFAGRSMNVPCLVTEQKVSTYINFDGRRDEVEIDAVDYPVDVIGLEGKMDFVGIYGLTGDFEGWFSNDEARIPIEAKMKVIIGSVTIELVQWNRPGWNPPRARD